MFIKRLRAKIHRATVTETDLHYIGSVAIDGDLLDRAGIEAYEWVLVVDVTNGARFETYVQPTEPGSGIVCVNGAAAHLVSKGDLIIIFAFGYHNPDDGSVPEPTLVFVDEKNRPIQLAGKR
jgi:aspartate 1-decarboxylase